MWPLTINSVKRLLHNSKCVRRPSENGTSQARYSTPLLGGRLEYFGGHAAAALVYGRRNHVINLFVWPSEAPARESSRTLNGYHMRSWSASGMTFWAVSDLDEAELGEFASSYRQNN